MQAAMTGRLSDQLALQRLDLGSQQPLLVGQLAGTARSFLLLAAQLGQLVTGEHGGLLQLSQGTATGLEPGNQVTLLAQVLQGGGEARSLGGGLVREGSGPASAARSSWPVTLAASSSTSLRLVLDMGQP